MLLALAPLTQPPTHPLVSLSPALNWLEIQIRFHGYHPLKLEMVKQSPVRGKRGNASPPPLLFSLSPLPPHKARARKRAHTRSRPSRCRGGARCESAVP